MQRKYYTLRDIAAIYGISLDTLRTWARSGHLPTTKVGRAYMVSADVIDARFCDGQGGGNGND